MRQRLLPRRPAKPATSTKLFELNQKKSVYEKFGVPSCWMVVPGPARPQVTALGLRGSRFGGADPGRRPPDPPDAPQAAPPRGSRFVEIADVTGDEVFRARRPFTVEIIPARLVAGLPPA